MVSEIFGLTKRTILTNGLGCDVSTKFLQEWRACRRRSTKNVFLQRGAPDLCNNLLRGLVRVRAVLALVRVRRAHGLTASGVEDGETLVVRCWIVTKISFLLGGVTSCVLNLLYMRLIFHALQAYARILSCMTAQRVPM